MTPREPSNELVLIEPPSGININLPNLDVAFSATVLGAAVIDLHACPWPAWRPSSANARRVAISRRSFNDEAAAKIREHLQRRRPDLDVLDLRGPVDVQCCYPFLHGPRTEGVEVQFGDDLPFPDYTLFDSFSLLRACWSSGLWAYPIMTSLGCPYGCAFCAARRRRWRPRSAAHTVGELELARKRWGIKSFEVIDDAFNVSRRRVLDICRRLAPLGLSWSCTNGLRADRFDDEVAAAMARSGCEHVGFGVESVDDDVLAGVGKGETFAQIERAVDVARRHLPRVSGFFIVGLPGSTRRSDLASVRWAERSGLDAVFSVHVPDPGASMGQVFYGATAEPRGLAYPARDQAEVYARAKRIKRGRYHSMLTGGLARGLLGALRLADWQARLNLAAIGVSKLPGMVLKGEIQ